MGDKFDENKDGTIDVTEMHTALNQMGQKVTLSQVQERMAALDENDDEKIDFDEFKVMVEQNWFKDAFQSKLGDTVRGHLMSTRKLLSGSSGNTEEDTKSSDDDDKDAEIDRLHAELDAKDDLMEDMQMEIDEKGIEVNQLKTDIE